MLRHKCPGAGPALGVRHTTGCPLPTVLPHAQPTSGTEEAFTAQEHPQDAQCWPPPCQAPCTKPPGKCPRRKPDAERMETALMGRKGNQRRPTAALRVCNSSSREQGGGKRPSQRAGGFPFAPFKAGPPAWWHRKGFRKPVPSTAPWLGGTGRSSPGLCLPQSCASTWFHFQTCKNWARSS